MRKFLILLIAVAGCKQASLQDLQAQRSEIEIRIIAEREVVSALREITSEDLQEGLMDDIGNNGETFQQYLERHEIELDALQNKYDTLNKQIRKRL